MERDDELKNLMLRQLEAQQALVEASKQEAIVATLKIEEYKKLQALESARIAEQKRVNELQEMRLAEAAKVYGLLMHNFEQKPIEQSIEQLKRDMGGRLDWLIEVSKGIRVISDLVARELLRVMSKDANSTQDRESLMNALIQIGRERSEVNLGTHFSSGHDINTRDVGDKTNQKD